MRPWAIAILALLPAGAAEPQDGGPVDFVRDIRPIFREHCLSCHSAAKKKGQLRLDARSAAMKGGMAGKAIVPGKASESPLYKLLIDADPDARMPQKAPPLPKEKADLIRRWIELGAPWPDSAAGEEAAAAHWSYVRPAAKPLPADGHPVDAFLAAAQKAKGVSPRPEASKATLLRRVYVDLIGLPPTVEELSAFVADPSPDAYERVVDRLLADPRHGERWGRHFMDIWRYSDWAGYQAEVRESQPNIWRWRDWIVESLHADKPYDRMIVEMLAGDEIAPEDPATLRATGFLVRNWRSTYARNVWLQDTVEHTAKAFLATTMNCARCHDHFFDPITHEEYYAFRAIFEPHDIRTDHLEGGAFDATKNGLARAFDAKPDAPTHRFERGDDRAPDKSKTIAPAVPRALGGALRIEPVTVPPSMIAPEKREFVRALALAAEDKAVSDAVQALGKGEAVGGLDVSVADARRVATAAVIEAERLEGTKGDAWKKAAEAALQAQRRLALLEAARAKFTAKQALDAKKGDAAKKLADAEKALAKAEADVKLPAGTAYTPRKIATYPATSSGRRLALARWIASAENPLTARVAVNHVWLRHFGAPLVSTTFDFGHNGRKPSHPELLDWLAAEFMKEGWSLRKLHRLMVTSAAYRRDSTGDPAGLAKDSENRLFWRMNVRRMESEAVRDSVLYVSGALDLARGGPELDQGSALTTTRRSLYYRHAHEKQAEFLRLFDAPNVVECYERSESIIPQQALALANSSLVETNSRALAAKLPPSEESFVAAAFEGILGRRPGTTESEECLRYLREAGAKGRESLVHVLFNHNDFVTIR